MGIGNWVYSASCKVKENVPDLIKAVTVDGAEKMKEYLPGSQGREKIKRIVIEVAVPQILKYTGIPGAMQIYRIFCENPSSSSVNDNDSKKYEPMPKELEKLKNRCEELKEEVEIIELENKILRERCGRFESQNKAFHQQPKEIQNAEECHSGSYDE